MYLVTCFANSKEVVLVLVSVTIHPGRKREHGAGGEHALSNQLQHGSEAVHPPEWLLVGGGEFRNEIGELAVLGVSDGGETACARPEGSRDRLLESPTLWCEHEILHPTISWVRLSFDELITAVLYLVALSGN